MEEFKVTKTSVVSWIYHT